MRNTFLIIAVFFLSATAIFSQQSPTQLAYIQRYKEIAIREMERVGVPASIKLAQGLLESNSGQSVLARRGNNHFGMKCGSSWEGGTIYREDDDYNDQGQLIKSCFRTYRNGQASFVAHSEFLRDPRKAFRYGFLFRLDPTDYQRWAYGLKQAGYATSPTYPEKLIGLIERYQLYQYDTALLADNGNNTNTSTPPNIPPTPPRTEPGGTTRPPTTGNTPTSGGNRLTILTNNDVRYTVVGEGETLDDIAQRVDASVRNLIAYNETVENVTQDLTAGSPLYLQPKRNGFRGRKKYHVVGINDNMLDLSQKYGVKLSKLLKRNRLAEDEMPAIGEQIKLRGWKVKERPKLRSEQPLPPRPNTTTRPNVPELPNGELDMEEPEEEDIYLEEELPPPPPVRNDPAPVVVQPENNNDKPVDVPVIIINQGSQPAPGTPATNSTPPPPITDTPPQTEPPVIINPTPAPPPTTTPTAQYHTVVSGDTLYNISRRYNTTVDALKSLNGLSNNNIQLGMQLRVK
ncbi:MAG: glucosaminidase domain-containing protein [Bacteroidota bacterium]